MLLAARASFAISRAKRWTNPYVTDGLVALWDGEWNAGGGKHEAAITSWLDCIGGQTMDVTGCGIGAMSVTISSGRSIAGSNNAIQTKSCSVEILAKVNSRTDFVFYSQMKRIALRDSAITNSRLYINMPTNENASYQQGTNTYYNLSSAKLVSLCGVSKWNSAQNFYVNGATPSRSTYGPKDATATSNFTLYGGLTVYSLRIYNRAITQAEDAANYAVDRARFNLS